MPLLLDIGGEGRHRAAWNLNPSRTATIGRRRGRPIPRLLVGRVSCLPFADGSIDCILVERTPLSRAALREIGRVVAAHGSIVLRHVPLADGDRHRLAKQVLSERKYRQSTLTIGRQTVQQTVFTPRG